MLEIIISYLDLETIKALRLIDRELSIRCVGPQFLCHVQQPNTDLTEESLTSLDALSKRQMLRQKIHELTILAVYYAELMHGDRLWPWQKGDRPDLW